MPDFDILREWIAVVALIAAAGSFLLYVLFVLGWVRPAGSETAKTASAAIVNAQNLQPTPTEVAELVKALASLSDSLAKAGPALWSLIGAALFLFIASLSAGVLQQAAETGPTRNSPTTGQASLPPSENLPVRH